MSIALDLLTEAARDADGFVELRYHDKTSRSIGVEKGKVERTQLRRRKGVAVRVLAGGGWGFASTSSLELGVVKRAMKEAGTAARASAARKRSALTELPPAPLARGEFHQAGLSDIAGRPLEEKIALACELEKRTRTSSARVTSASCGYSEIVEDKVIVTSDGAAAEFRLVRPELRLQAVAEKDGQLSTGHEAIGATGGWECLFRNGSGEYFADKAARTAVELLAATNPEGGRAQVILAPSIVGLLVHEAIGHTVEADFVQSGSVAAGKIGQRVASELVTLCDSGASEYYAGAGGTIPVDDDRAQIGIGAGVRDDAELDAVLTHLIRDAAGERALHRHADHG